MRSASAIGVALAGLAPEPQLVWFQLGCAVEHRDPNVVSSTISKGRKRSSCLFSRNPPLFQRLFFEVAVRRRLWLTEAKATGVPSQIEKAAERYETRPHEDRFNGIGLPRADFHHHRTAW